MSWSEQAGKNRMRWLLPLAAALLVSGFLLVLMQLIQTLVENNLRQEQESYLAQIRTQLEAKLNQAGNASASFSYYIQSYEGQLQESRLESMATRLLQRHKVIRNIAFAPDNIIAWNFPLEENSFTHGVNLMQLPQQAEAIRKIMRNKEPVLAGPVELIQGGLAVIHRVPVFTEDAGGKAHYWGMVSTPILMDALLEAAGIKELVSTGRLAFRGKNGKGAQGAVFLGPADLFKQPQALKIEIRALDGSWQLAYLPTRSHPFTPGIQSFLYLFLLLVFLLVFWLTRKSLQDSYHAFISEKKAAQLGERLQVATEAAGLGCWELNLPTGQLYWDEKMFRIYQVNPQDFSGDNRIWEACLFPGEKERIESIFAQLKPEQKIVNDEFKIHRGDGQVRLIKNSVRILRSSQGDIRSLVGINEDITEERETAARLLATQEEEKRLNEIMAHHFQEPARRLLIFSEQLLRNPVYKDEKARQAIDFIRQQAHYLRSLVQGIQKYMQVTQQAAPKKALDLEVLVHQCLQRCQNAENALALDQVQLLNQPWPEVHANPAQLAQVFDALLDNACKHACSNQQLQITLFAETRQGRLYLSFNDNGKGLEPRYYQQALELFLNLDKAIKSPTSSGLGLPLIKKIIGQHQGQVQLKKSPLGGLGVLFDLPIHYTSTKRDST